MTLSDLTMLVNRLTTSLQAGGPSASDQDLADDYAEACVRINERLVQCSRMIDEGSSVQALMLAEEKPNLLDAVAALSFSQANNWHEACALSALRQAPKIDRSAVHKVNELYNKGNKTEQTKALYKQFRAAMASRNDASALDTIRTIASLDPADVDAAKELARLERKLSEDLLKALGVALTNGNEEEVLALLEQCQRLGLSGAPEMGAALDVQKKVFASKAAQEIAQILPALADLQNQGRWQQCGERAARVNSLSATYGLVLPAAESASVAGALAYFESCRNESMQKARFKESLSSLADCADRTRAGDRPALKHSLDEVQEHRLRLKKAYEKSKEFMQPMPDALVAKVSQVASELDAEIERLTKGRRVRNVSLAAGLALLLTALVVGGYFFVRAGQFAGELRSLMAESKAIPLRERVAELKSGNAIYMSMSSLKLAILEAEAWLDGISAKTELANSALAKARSLSENSFASSTPDEASAVFEQARKAIEQLPKDIVATMMPQFVEAENRLSIWLATMRDEKVVGAKAKIHQTRELAAKVESAATGEEMREAVAALTASVEGLLAAANSQVEQLNLPEAMKAEVAELVAKQETAADVLDAYDSALKGLSAATSLGDYSAAIEKLSQVPLPRSQVVKSAQLIATKKVDAHQFLGAMILPGSPEVWAAVKDPQDLLAGKQPALTRESEVERLRELINNDDIAGIHEAVVQDRDGPPSSYRERRIFIRGRMEVSQPGDGVTRATGIVYDPALSPGRLHFEEKTFEHVYTASTSMQRGQRVDKQKETEGSAALQRLGLEALVSSDGSKYRQNILQTIDKVMRAQNIPPLVKGFAIQELAAIARARPNEWGLAWVPAFELKSDEIKSLTGGKIDSGDWMVPTKSQAGNGLAEWFKKQEDFSFGTQQSINRQLAKSALEAGLVVCGYIGPEGNLVETNKEALAGASELWAMGSQDGVPVVAYTRVKDSAGESLQSMGKALPLSPVFTLPLQPTDAIDSALKAAQVSEDEVPLYLKGLPPFFAKGDTQAVQPPND